jgi:8-amino-7-oxononanoate synthase
VNNFDTELKQRLDALRGQNLLRELRRIDSPQSPRVTIGGTSFLNFSSNDYLGLANEPALNEAAIKAVERFGSGAGASRLICGSLAPHHELEEALAAFKKTEAALTFSSGYAAALGTITALLGKEDIVILDKLVHACIVDAAKLSRAKLRVYAHNDLNDLEAKLAWASEQRAHAGKRATLVVTESVFSMDGDRAPLKTIVKLKEEYGAWLMVDEAHATGICGTNGRGLADEAGVSHRIEIQMGTLGKALGASGGYICGSRWLIDYLINRARSFVFSTAPFPAAAAAAAAALKLVQSTEGEHRRQQLWQHVSDLKSRLPDSVFKTESAIVPIGIGEENAALDAAETLNRQGIYVPAIRYPTVARGSARLRITLTAAHTAADVTALTDALRMISPTAS